MTSKKYFKLKSKLKNHGLGMAVEWLPKGILN